MSLTQMLAYTILRLIRLIAMLTIRNNFKRIENSYNTGNR